MTCIFWLAQVALAKTLSLPGMLLSWFQRPVFGKPHRCRCASLIVFLHSYSLGCQYEATLTAAMRSAGVRKDPAASLLASGRARGRLPWKTDQLFVEKGRRKLYVENGRVRRSPTCLLWGQQSTVCILHGAYAVMYCGRLGKVRWESQIMPATTGVEN